MSGTDFVHVDRGWLLLLRDAGLDPARVLRRATLPADLFIRSESRLTTGDFIQLWTAIEEEADDDAFPVRLADAMSTEAFHPALFAAMCSPNLRVAARRMAQYKRIVAPMLIETVDEEDGLFVGIRWQDPTIPIPPGFAVAEIAFMTRLARMATRVQIRPVLIESPHAFAGRGQLESWFGTKIQRAPRHGATFSLEDTERPFLTENPALWQTFEPELRRRLAELDASAPLSERVRSVLLESLPSGEFSIEVVSRRLGIGHRTLQRKLKAEGTSYQAVVAGTRKELAHHYIRDPHLAYAEISFLVGFDEPSSFFRAFRQWTGMTPEAARARAMRSTH